MEPDQSPLRDSCFTPKGDEQAGFPASAVDDLLGQYCHIHSPFIKTFGKILSLRFKRACTQLS
jgi:hypothetical protein